MGRPQWLVLEDCRFQVPFDFQSGRFRRSLRANDILLELLEIVFFPQNFLEMVGQGATGISEKYRHLMVFPTKCSPAETAPSHR